MLVRTTIKYMLGRGAGSQFDEDAILASVVPEQGRYLDVGAYHPHLYSNTYALYRRGWRGVAVDPNPQMALLWKLFRYRDRFINSGVGKPGSGTYYMYADGAYNSFEPVPGRRSIAQKTICILPLAQLLREPVDFLNIDCEGMDAEILQTHDWSTKPSVIATEGKEGDTAYQLLISKGYALYAKTGMTLIYVLPASRT